VWDQDALKHATPKVKPPVPGFVLGGTLNPGQQPQSQSQQSAPANPSSSSTSNSNSQASQPPPAGNSDKLANAAPNAGGTTAETKSRPNGAAKRRNEGDPEGSEQRTPKLAKTDSSSSASVNGNAVPVSPTAPMQTGPDSGSKPTAVQQHAKAGESKAVAPAKLFQTIEDVRHKHPYLAWVCCSVLTTVSYDCDLLCAGQVSAS